MSEEQNLFLIGLCLLAGYLFGGFLTADVVSHCVAGAGVRYVGTGEATAKNVAKYLGQPAGMAVVVGDAAKTALACWFCYRLAAPELEHLAMLYGGFGAVLGHCWPIWYKGHGGNTDVVTCTWIILYLPITGVLCFLAGAVATAGTKQKAMGALLVTALAVPVALLQFGIESSFMILLATLLLLWQSRKKIFRANRGKRPLSSG